LRERQAAGRDALLAGLRSERYVTLLDRLVDAVRDPLVSEGARRPSRKALPPLLERAWRRLEPQAVALKPDDPDERYHAVRIRAAGGVLWRETTPDSADPAVEVAIIHRPRYGDWTLPKGKLATGESEVDGAIREVLEETGHRIRLGRALGETRYFKEQGGFLRPKVVRWWAMEASGGGFTPTREVDDLRWVTLAEAHEALTRETDRELLERFVRGPAPTREVLLVRHASAGS